MLVQCKSFHVKPTRLMPAFTTKTNIIISEAIQRNDICKWKLPTYGLQILLLCQREWSPRRVETMDKAVRIFIYYIRRRKIK